MAGTLYIVATPIGNLEDVTLRAIRTLKEVDLIAAEDTRHTLKLLNHLEISKPMISYYKETEKVKAELLIKKLIEGNNVALVSDAGTPGISDPGEEVIKQAIENEIKIVPIPGACAAISALVGAGVNTKEFVFLGFLSANKKERKEKLEENKNEIRTMVFYEAPHKLLNTLKDIQDILGNRYIVLAKELTKIHEGFVRGKIQKIIEEYIEPPKGEFVIVVEGAEKGEQEILQDNLNMLSLEKHYEYYQKQGKDKKEIVKQIAKDRKVPKNEIYQCFIKYF